MMNRRILTAVTAIAVAAGSFAQINSPEAGGYIERGIRMYQDANYNGCIDQMLQVRQLSPTPTEAEEALYYVAMSTMGIGDDEALGLLQSYLARYPQTTHRQEVLATIGDFYFTRAAYGDAVTAYLKVDPSTLDGATYDDYRYRLAYSYMMLGEYDKAEPLMRALQSTTAYGDAARFYEAYMEYSRQNYDKALTLFKKVNTAKEPGNTADYYLAQLYFRNGEYTQALSCAKRIIAANPVPEYTIEARRIAGESLFNLGQAADAVPYLWEYVSQAAEPMPSAYYILGIQEYEGGDYKAAIKLFQQVVGETSAIGQNAYLYLGQCYLKTGNTNSALMAFENAYRMNYDPKVQETALYNYAVAQSQGGKVPFSSSVKVFEDFLTQYPNSRYAANIQKYLVTGYITDDNYESALESINKIVNPSDDILLAKQRVLFVLGTRDYTNGKTAMALNRLTEAREITPSNKSIADQAALWSGDCYFADKKWRKAEACYKEYLDSAAADAPNRQLAYYNLGYTYYNQKQYIPAIEQFSNACNTKGALTKTALADARDRMADCYALTGDFKAAAAMYQKAFDTNPSSGDYALYQQAMMKGYENDYTQQLQLLDTMMDRFPSSPLYPAALLSQAETYTTLGETSKAISAYKTLVRDFPQSSYGRNGQLQLAITYLNGHDRANAIEAYKKVIYSYPTSEEARTAADDLKRIYAEDSNLNEYVVFMNSIPNAPEINPSDIEATAYAIAEEYYLDDRGTDKLKSYIKEYPSGAYKAQALYYLAEDAEDTGNYDDAYRYAIRVVNTYPDSEMAEEALAIKASCELHQGKGEIALESYKQLEEKASTPGMLHDARMQIMRVARDLDKNAEMVATAEKLLASTAAGGNELDEIHFTHAYGLDRLGRYDEAETEWTALAKEPTDLYGAKSAFYMAQSQYNRGLTEKAEKTIGDLLDSETPHDYWRARGIILLSDILRKQGNSFEADEYLRAIRNNYTGTEDDITEMINERLGN